MSGGHFGARLDDVEVDCARVPHVDLNGELLGHVRQDGLSAEASFGQCLGFGAANLFGELDGVGACNLEQHGARIPIGLEKLRHSPGLEARSRLWRIGLSLDGHWGAFASQHDGLFSRGKAHALSPCVCYKICSAPSFADLRAN